MENHNSTSGGALEAETGHRIEYVALDRMVPADLNPKRHDVGAIIVSMRRFGFVAPAITNEATGRIVVGHGRAEALTQMRASGEAPPDRIAVGDRGEWLVPVVRGISFATDADAEAYLVADNRLTELGGWDDGDLLQLLGGLGDEALVAATGFDADDIEAMTAGLVGAGAGADDSTVPDVVRMVDAFGVPPFTILDARQGYWQERKRGWLAKGIQSEVGRGGNLVSKSKPREGYGGDYDIAGGESAWGGSGTSIFDPVLCELVYRWFNVPGGAVLDPFAGGSVRGIVASACGCPYTGVDLSAEQVAANQAQLAAGVGVADQQSGLTPVEQHGGPLRGHH